LVAAKSKWLRGAARCPLRVMPTSPAGEAMATGKTTWIIRPANSKRHHEAYDY